jgi:hypothetical protein
MRTLLIIAGMTAILLLVDTIVLDGKYRQAVWREAQNRAHTLNYNLNRMMRFAGPAR